MEAMRSPASSTSKRCLRAGDDVRASSSKGLLRGGDVVRSIATSVAGGLMGWVRTPRKRSNT
jgi:hypothetical protein